jgi:hypothetical protein
MTVGECDERTFAKLMAAIKKVVMGQPIGFVFEEGMHRIVDDGKPFDMPNGTLTIRIFVNGGARDSGVEADVQGEIRGGAGDGGQSGAVVHPALEANLD